MDHGPARRTAAHLQPAHRRPGRWDDVGSSRAPGPLIAALQTAVAEGNLKDLQVTNTPDGFEATYVDSNDYLQYTTEKWIAFEGETAYAALAVTGRSVDLEGMRDLLDRVSTSATPLDPLPKEDEES